MKAWALFGAAVLVAIAGLGWMSAELLRLDERALVSENSRLALWRMDLALARLIASESTRAPSQYAPGSGGAGSVLLHFDVAPGGAISTAERGADELVSQLRPHLVERVAPVAVANANDDSRNAGEFNRRAVFATNNFAPRGREFSESPMAPAWYDDKLVLVRRVRLEDGLHLQGAWLDWPALSPWLLDQVKDLFASATLEPVKVAQQGDAMMLASLPVRLVPGAPAQVAERTSLTGVIAAAWVALGLVVLALGALLFGVLALDERRAAFVSAVTHELRTPLTTFKLYAEMLEEGMVPLEKQQQYLSTLRQEANRLGYLVENVLAYAQIERGRKGKPLEELPSTVLLERIIPRLHGRAPALQVGAIPSIMVQADRVSVEQILFNLVDNACKYAAGAKLTMSFSSTNDALLITLTDAGPGVAPEVERKLFEPLRKSAAEAAEGAQGIGLGLALSRKLARAMGGDLRYRKRKGAAFELDLRLSRK